MSLQASNEKYIVISVMGPHAGESEDEIFQRKIGDISKIGLSLWLIKSHQAKPNMVQDICGRINTLSIYYTLNCANYITLPWVIHIL